jgi:hypothetical protein
MPALKVCVQNLKSNAERWSKYEETETDKQVYIKLAGNMEQINEEQEDVLDDENYKSLDNSNKRNGDKDSEKSDDNFDSFDSDEEDCAGAVTNKKITSSNDSKKKKLVKF